MVVVTTLQTDAPGREGVLDAAAALFVEHGYAATTLRQIAAAAGIKAGSIYHHFASKEDLFVRILDRGIAVMIEAFEGVAPVRGDVHLHLLAHVRAHLGALFEHGSYTAAHVTAFFTAPDDVRRRVVPVRDSYEQLWNLLLGEMLGDVGARELPLLRLVLFGSMNSTIEWFDPNGDTTLDQLAALITDQFLNGVRA